VRALAVVLVFAWGGCTLDFPEEWLEGECGDGYVGQGEQCDDGDTNSGDGCSDTCTEEYGFECVGVPSVCTSTCGDGELASNEECDDGNTVSGDLCDEFCQIELVGCGDGEIQSADGETCDDSNNTAFDGCSDLCDVEAGWICNGAPSICVEICGDGSVVGAEALQEGCDDGNLDNLDGCDFQCQVEPGYICVGEPSVCQTGCGDGIVAGVEVCDDGNTALNDGCDAICQPEDGFVCDGASPTVCTAICGDGTVVGAEAQAGGCDDGNTAPDDGCAADCTEEAGWSCSGEPSTCTTVCGDNITAGGEVCDDGNTSSCDGCRGDCLANETGCGDGAICGTEACDDGNTDWGDGCGGTCMAVEAGWTCQGEPSVCTLGCTQPEALFLQAGCNAGEMCTITAFSGGSYVCVAEGSNPYYGSCTGYQTCVAGAACDNINAGLMCYPYCDINEPTWTCPMNGSEPAICLYFYPQGQTISGICVANECDAVAQTGCSSGWCERYFGGVALCNTADPPGTVAEGNICVQSNPSGPSEMCLPGLTCINTGANDECLELCRLAQSDCTGGEFCVTWSPPDPVYGICQ
jgi:cysteine-rich repeat protein